MHAKKSLGQNFLKSKVIVSRMAKASGVSVGDTVIEIGPGKGILTDALLETGARIIAVEKDRELIPFLSKKFSEAVDERRLKIIEADILKVTEDELGIKGKIYHIVANIPYYITGELLRIFLSRSHQPHSMTLLVQKEVARRIVAHDKKESILSLSVKLYGIPHLVEIVKRTMFTPAPNVDSAVIHIESISKTKLKDAQVSEKDFFEVIKMAFSQKRKQLVGNLKSFKKSDELIELLSKKNIPVTVRAEDIPFTLWLELVRALKN
jgi:16S rRNA (adenine1518-N6/adenine1519-N6)-dimethyltransferase